MLIIGHRGAMGLAPENTLASMRKAMECGVYGVEFDVQNIDQQLIVFHDDTLDRTTNGSGKVCDYSFSELRLLDAGGGEQIPTLDEVCELIGDRIFINIELKGLNTVELIQDLINFQITHRELLLLSSYHLDELKLCRELDSNIRLAVIADEDIEETLMFAQSINAYSFHPCLAAVTQELVEQTQAFGMKLFVHTVNEPEDIKRMEMLGVDGIFTDFPDRVNT